MKLLGLAIYARLAVDGSVLPFLGCPSIRNKDLVLVREAAPRIRHLELGSNMTLPCVTNKGLEHLSPIRGLVVLNLNECRAITGNGLRALSSLTALHTLSLRGCAAIHNKYVRYQISRGTIDLYALKYNVNVSDVLSFGGIQRKASSPHS